MFLDLIFYLISDHVNVLDFEKLGSAVSEGRYERICVFPSHGISFACRGWCPKTLSVKKILRKKSNGGGFYYSGGSVLYGVGSYRLMRM